MILPLLLGFILGAATIVFALQNPEVVSLNFFGRTFEASLALIIVLTAAIGGLLGVLVSLPNSIGKSIVMRRLRRENQGLRDENVTLTRMNEEYRLQLQMDATSEHPQTIDLRQ